jgi:hypothetical protein
MYILGVGDERVFQAFVGSPSPCLAHTWFGAGEEGARLQNDRPVLEVGGPGRIAGGMGGGRKK